MFDLSNPQQRERFLVIVTGIALFLAAAILAPGQFAEIARKKIDRDKLVKDIENHQRHAKNKDTIQSRLSAMEGQALTSGGGEAVLRYQNWLRDLATGSGLANVTLGNPSTAGRREGFYTKHTFPINGTGRLDQIAEFLRRFHRTEYLHMIQNVQPRLAGNNQPGMFNVSFRIEALSLPQIDFINVPSVENFPETTDEERQMLTDIRTRAILSEFTPPPPPLGQDDQTRPPPPPPFDDIAYCFVTGIVETDGKPQCWIRNRITERTYYLSEEGAFTLGGVRCTIKNIDWEAQRVYVDIAGGLYSINIGKNFDEVDEQEPPIDAVESVSETTESAPDAAE